MNPLRVMNFTTLALSATPGAVNLPRPRWLKFRTATRARRDWQRRSPRRRRHVEDADETSAATTPGAFALDRLGFQCPIRHLVEQNTCQCFAGTNSRPHPAKPQRIVSAIAHTYTYLCETEHIETDTNVKN